MAEAAFSMVDVAKAGFRDGFDSAKSLSRATAIFFGLSFVIDVVAALAGFQSPTAGPVALFVGSVVKSAVLAPYAVLVHRRLILGEQDDDYWTAVGMPRTLRFFGVLVLFNATAAAIPTFLAMSGLWANVMIGAVGSITAVIVVVIVSLRLILALPVIAADRSITPLAYSWERTRGEVLRILGTMILVVLPFMAVMFLAILIGADPVDAFGVAWVFRH